MKNTIRFIISNLLIFSFFTNVLPCGPAYITPVFDYKKAPENPYENFAAGRIGILKPTYHRSVLFAAYRYFNDGSFSAAEQKALIDVWNAEFNNKKYEEDDVSTAVKQWLEERKDVMEKEEKTPEIYVEREYGGYDFFPNCTKNAFETAAETLKDRKTSHGADSRDVKEWVVGQDKVFTNCSSGKQTPDEANPAMPEWLQKDRAYQSAAASFYALDYADARRRFAEIAQDAASPWQETAEYLVGRTMIRQASLTKDKEKADQIYAEAEEYLYRLSVGGNKYRNSAENLLGLIKYRLRPQDRVRELAQTLSYQGGADNFRQHLIDYTWLLDKFESEALAEEEKRKEALKPKDESMIFNTNSSNYMMNSNMSSMNSSALPTNLAGAVPKNPKKETDLEIYIFSDDYDKNWTIFIDENASDEEALAEAARVTGMTLTEKMREQVINMRKTAYSNRFSSRREDNYQGRYYGEEETTLSILPEFLRADDLTDWLFTYQTSDAESYLYSLDKFKQNRSDLWLATAISKADASSAELELLFEAAAKVNANSPAFATVAYHRARLLLETKKPSEARRLLDEVLNSPFEMPISSRNQFLDLRLGLAETLDEYLFFAQRKPFAFDWGGEGKTVEQIIEDRKSWYNPEYDKMTKEEYDRDIEREFGEERLWQDRVMFDDKTIQVINEYFPVEVMLQAAKSAALPEYLKERFVSAAFVRALLLEDYPTAQKIAPEFAKYKPDMQTAVKEFLAAAPNRKKYAAYYLILKNENLSPYIAAGTGKPWEQPVYASRWWCAPYDEYYNEDIAQSLPKSSLLKPVFITKAQKDAAANEAKRLKEIGDAPRFLAEAVLAWSKTAPRDRRIPESLFIVYEANDWDKYGCGGHTELRKAAANVLRTRYPSSEFTRQLADEPQQ
jgi:hypothetical protein